LIWQKRVPGHAARLDRDGARHVSVRDACRRAVRHRARALVWAANLATLEFGAWPSRRRDPEKPDELRIDIDDRQPGTGFAEAKRVAALVHEVLDEIGYTGWPKTSGNRGIHVLLPHRAELGLQRSFAAGARVRARDRSVARPSS